LGLIAPVAEGAEREGWLEAAADSLLVMGEAAIAAGEWAGAERVLSRALGLAGAAGLPRPEWEAHAALASLEARSETAGVADHAACARSIVQRTAETVQDEVLRRGLIDAAAAKTTRLRA